MDELAKGVQAMSDDVKTLREAAFACTIRYANIHMSTNDRLYFDAIKICFNRMADMIEREGAPAPEWRTGNEPEYSRADLHHLDAIISGGAENAAKRPALVDLMAGVPIALSEAEDRGWNAALEKLVSTFSATFENSQDHQVVRAFIIQLRSTADLLRRGAS